MKKMMIAAAMALLLFGAIPAQAESHGSAYTPNLYLQTTSTWEDWNQILLSNITDHEITCTVKIYNHDGEDISDTIIFQIKTGSNTGEAIGLGTGKEFAIPAHGSRCVVLYSSSDIFVYGHGIIEWESASDNLACALIGSVIGRANGRGNISKYGVNNVTINGGQPF